MKSILFVDDEPNVLSGLQRMLRGMRKQWDMSFVDSGQAALDLLARKKIDIIVTDMRMPGIDGAELLIKVKALYPHIVRMILSGHSDQTLLLKAVKPAHQYLAKPCEADTLIKTINQACVLSGCLPLGDLAGLVSELDALPTPGDKYQQLMDELNSGNASLRKIGEIISRDMGMTASVLKVVNSAFFGLRRHISTPMDAVNLLGLDLVKGLAISANIFGIFEKNKMPGFSFEELWEHSINTGGIAKRIAMHENCDKKLCDESFIAGLMHDLGKLILASLVPADYNEILELVRRDNCSISLVEQDILGTTHGEVGAYLMGLWGMSAEIVQALAFHHCTSLCPDRDFSPLFTVHVANYLEHELRIINPHYARRRYDATFLDELGLEGKMTEWLKLGKDLLECEAANE